MYSVKDGQRTLEFEGRLLAESTSQRAGGTRWVEFYLYRTNGGSYILSRIGCSVIFHARRCSLVSQYNLKIGQILETAVPCDSCDPDYDENELYPEKIRNWAQVMERPEGIVEALYKYDADGARYLTLVAQRLLDSASLADDGIRRVYKTEFIR